MKRVCLIVIGILTATGIASAQTTFYYPHVINGVIGPYTLKTTILLTNPASSGTASGTITFTRDTNSRNLQLAGSPFVITLTDESGATTTASTFTFSLVPGATRRLVSNGAGASVSGFATVATSAGTVSGTAIFSQFDSSGNLVAEAGVPSAIPVPRQAIFVDTIDGYSIGVAYANPGGAAANVTLNLLDSGAMTVASTTQILGTGNHVQGFTFQMFNPPPPPMAGTMQIISDSSPLVAIALRFDPPLLKFTTLPPVTLASLINPALEWLQERPWLTPLTSIARLLGSLQLRIG